MTDIVLQIPEFPLQMEFTPERFPPVNRCIYCGSHSNKLSDEHIIPFGLAGDAYVLKKASCTNCGRITGKFEQACLRKTLGPFRIRVGSPTRNPKERPEKLLHYFTRKIDGKHVPAGTKEIAAKDFPLTYLALRLHPPGILQGLPVSNEVRGELWFRTDMEEAKKQNLTSDTESIVFAQINPLKFARMLAKIAYSYAVAKVGYGKFRPLVLKLILGKTDTLSHWVGGDWDIPPADQWSVHTLEIYQQEAVGRTFLVVSIRLFPFFGTPVYRVVVGDFPDPKYQLALGQQSFRGKAI
jgi:hypothetical protein